MIRRGPLDFEGSHTAQFISFVASYAGRHRQVSKKSFDIVRPQVTGMALAVKMDIAFNPVYLNLLGANAAMLDAQLVAHLIQQFGRFNRGAFIRKIRVC